MLLPNISREPKDIVEEILSRSTIYTIHCSELRAYDPTDGNKRRISQMRRRGQEECLMIMLPEGSGDRNRFAISVLVDTMRGKDRRVYGGKIKGLAAHPYLLITEPDVIELIKAIGQEKIRSFKEDLFPNAEIQRIPKNDRISWHR